MSRTALAAVALLAVVTSGCNEQVASVEGSGSSPSTIVAVTASASTSPTVPPPSTIAVTTIATTTSSTTTTTSTTVAPTTTAVPTTTSCDQVVHIGDSTAVPLFQSSGVGGADLTLDARYRAVGVRDVYPDNDGGRSIIEALTGQANAIDVAAAVVANGYDGCWVLMVGTNDAANIAAGAAVSAEERIRGLLDTIGGHPVVFVDAITQRTDGPYRNASMLTWDQELYRVTAEYPNVRVLRWYDIAEPQWFREDGLHYNVEGSARRAEATAQALVTFFPD